MRVKLKIDVFLNGIVALFLCVMQISTMPMRCSVCITAPAAVYCYNDDAILCTSCDLKYHENPLTVRHERRPVTSEDGSSLREQDANNPSDLCVSPQCSSDDCGVVPQCGNLLAGPVCARSASFPSLEIGEEDFLAWQQEGDFFMESGDPLRMSHDYSCPRLTDLDLEIDLGLDAVVPSVTSDDVKNSNPVGTNMDLGRVAVLPPAAIMPEQQLLYPNPLKNTGENILFESQAPILVPQTVDAVAHPQSDQAAKLSRTEAITKKEAAASPQKAGRNSILQQQTNCRRRSKRRLQHRDGDEAFLLDNEIEDAGLDSSDDEFSPSSSHARRRGVAGRRDLVIEPLVQEEPQLTREERIQRYRLKKARRNFSKKVRYQSRKAYADIRPRIKGRFVSPEEYAAYMKEKNQGLQDNVAVVPCC